MAVQSTPSIAEAPGTPVPANPRRRALDSALGIVGEILITAGVLLGLFVLWQLFYTDVQSGRTQAAALDEIAWAEPVRVPAAAGQAPDAEVGTPEQTDLIPEDLKVYSPDGAPVLASPATADTFATVHGPRWGYDYVKPISEGVSRAAVLDELGIGHYPKTAMPGAVGNFSIAGHRTTYGKPFTDIDQLQEGDAIVVQTESAWYVYRVTSTAIVAPTFVAAIAPTPDKAGVPATVASITLTSCHPRYSAAQRYIVHGELEYWAPTGHGYPSEIVENA